MLMELINKVKVLRGWRSRLESVSRGFNDDDFELKRIASKGHTEGWQ